MKETSGSGSRLFPRAVIVLSTLLISCQSAAQTASAAPKEEMCEPRLLDYVRLLQDQKELWNKKYLYSGPPPGANWSKCRVVGHWPLWPKYWVYRSDNNISLIIEQVPRGKRAVLYGPIDSTYRK